MPRGVTGNTSDFGSEIPGSTPGGATTALVGPLVAGCILLFAPACGLVPLEGAPGAVPHPSPTDMRGSLLATETSDTSLALLERWTGGAPGWVGETELSRAAGGEDGRATLLSFFESVRSAGPAPAGREEERGAEPSAAESRSPAGDRALARRALATGRAMADLLRATRSAITVEDPDPRSWRRFEAFTSRLLEDPLGAPRELLCRFDLTLVERLALEDVARRRGAERLAAVVELFAGTRYVLRARARFGEEADRILAAEAPRSTWEILFPERSFDHAPLRVEIEPPTGAARRLLAGAVGFEGSIGAAGVWSWLGPKVGFREALAAARGWAADRLFATEPGKGPGILAWRAECTDEGAARRLAALLERAHADVSKGRSLAVLRDGRSVAFVLRTDGREAAPAARGLLGAPARVVEEGRSAKQGALFRVLRALSSPLVSDTLRRWDRDANVLWGGLLRVRSGPERRRVSLLGPPLALLDGPVGRSLLDRGWLVDVSSGGSGWDVSALFDLVRAGADDDLGSRRFEVRPLFAWRFADGAMSLEALGGALLESRRGPVETSGVPLVDWTTVSFGGRVRERVFGPELLRYARREGRDWAVSVLPFGLLGELRVADGEGWEARAGAGLLSVRRVGPLGSERRTEVEVGFGLLAFERDPLLGRSGVRVLPLGGRHLLAFGRASRSGDPARGGRWFAEAAFLRLIQAP